MTLNNKCPKSTITETTKYNCSRTRGIPRFVRMEFRAGLSHPFSFLALLPTFTTLTGRACQREQNRNSSRACSFWSVCTEGAVETSTRGPVRASFLRVAYLQHSFVPFVPFVPECTALFRLPNGGGDRSSKWSRLGGLVRPTLIDAYNWKHQTLSRLQLTSLSASGICKATVIVISLSADVFFILRGSAVDTMVQRFIVRMITVSQSTMMFVTIVHWTPQHAQIFAS
jgi:hypothetical protein